MIVCSHQKRIFRTMAKKELFSHRVLGWFITKLGAFPVDRFAVGWTIGAVISVANLIWGLDQTRTWIKNNKKNGENITDLAAKGINAAADYMGKSIGNAIVGVYTALNLTGWWPVTAIAWVTA